MKMENRAVLSPGLCSVCLLNGFLDSAVCASDWPGLPTRQLHLCLQNRLGGTPCFTVRVLRGVKQNLTSLTSRCGSRPVLRRIKTALSLYKARVQHLTRIQEHYGYGNYFLRSVAATCIIKSQIWVELKTVPMNNVFDHVKRWLDHFFCILLTKSIDKQTNRISNFVSISHRYSSKNQTPCIH